MAQRKHVVGFYVLNIVFLSVPLAAMARGLGYSDGGFYDESFFADVVREPS